MRCPSCHRENPESTKFCGNCGAPLNNRCARCGAENPRQFKFCGECGAPLRAGSVSSPRIATGASPSATGHFVEQPSVQAHDVPEGERKVLTALFADIKGSTALMEDLDPEEARAIIDPALQHMIDAVHRYDGYVVQSTGDGIFALFGAPLAHEDHPQRALYAALQMRDALREYGAKLAENRGHGLEARIGINTGEVVVREIETSGHTEYTPIGHTANLAARIQTVAPAGSIAISEPTKRLVGGYFELRALGPSKVKGVSGAVEVYEVTAAGPLRTHFELAAQRGLTKFVGREHELAAMRRALEQTIACHGQVVAAVGEAGAGKSRLIHEFKRLAQERCKLLEAYSVSHGKAAAWMPVVELLNRYFEIAEGDDEPRRGGKVRAKVRALDAALEDTLPYIESLLGIREAAAALQGMDAQVKRRRTLEAIKRLLIRESLTQPLVVIFEDLHWIDEETQQLLDLMVESAPSAAVLLLVNYRPEYSHRWNDRSYYTQLRLNPLGQESSKEMLAALIGDDAGLEPLKRLIAERTQGNPFFIEEIVQALFEQGVLTRNGAVSLARPLTEVKIPPTVQGILASRIDRLPAAEKDLLQRLAVLGKDFTLPLVKAVARQRDEQLLPLLSRLGRAEFVYEQPAFAEAEYTFKHALTQEVAYSSMLIEQRRRLHLQAAGAIETLYQDRINRHYDELIRHYEHGGEVHRAVGYLRLAGRQAFDLSAHAEQLKYIDREIELNGTRPDGPQRSEVEILAQIDRADTLGLLKGWGAEEVGTAAGRALELCRQTGNQTALMLTLFQLRMFHQSRVQSHKAAAVGREHLALAQRLGDRYEEAFARRGLGDALYTLGEFALSREHYELATALCEAEFSRLSRTSDEEHGERRIEGPYGLRILRSALAILSPLPLWLLGFPDQARKKSEQALVLTREGVAHPHAVALLNTALVHFWCGKMDPVRELIDRASALIDQYGLNPNLMGFVSVLRAMLHIEQGRAEEAIATLRVVPWALLPLAAAYAATGQAQAALGSANNAVALFAVSEDRIWEAETHRYRGELLLIQPQPDQPEAERCFRTAIEIARRQSAKSWELRATTSLARLLDKQGRGEEERQMVAEIYGWFTEGFDTADLKEAKALLFQLNRH